MYIFITHYTPLVERKNHISNQLDKYNFKYEYITNYDRETLTEKELNLFNSHRLRLSEISLSLKHFECYKKIVFENHDYALILEDDVFLSENFEDKLNQYFPYLCIQRQPK